jgi:hypothetical protein
VSFSWYAVIDEHGSDTGRRGRCRAGTYDVAALLRRNIVFPGYPVIRRAAVDRAGPFDRALPATEDFDFVLRLAALREHNTACIPEVLCEYRRRPGQMSSNWVVMQNGWRMTWERAELRSPAAARRMAREAAALNGRYLGYLALEGGDFAAARRLLARAWRTHPLALARDRRTWPTTFAAAATLLPAALVARLRESVLRGRAGRARTAARREA